MPLFLVVDDDPAVAGTFARMLEVAGYQVTSAHSCDAGLAAAQTHRPDAILADLRMPRTTGLEFVRRVRRDASLREVPIGIVTGDHYLSQPTLGEIEALGATVHFKPLTFETLVAVAKQLIQPNAS